MIDGKEKHTATALSSIAMRERSGGQNPKPGRRAPGLKTHHSAIRRVTLGRSGLRRSVVVLGYRIAEIAGGRRALGGCVLFFLTARDVLAAVDAFGFVGAARHGDADADFDFRMHGDGDLIFAEVLTGGIEQDLAAADDDASGLEEAG